uniref:Uncharacterized protein n=1 Tax=Rhizophora mucronata TaxID=61149 RepID=A0A2P2P3M0_RHIMU
MFKVFTINWGVSLSRGFCQ